MSDVASASWVLTEDESVLKWSGMLGATVTRTLSGNQVATLDSSLGSRFSDKAPSQSPRWGMEDLCPDPLVFAIGTGLPRLRLLATQIDGGSEWENWSPIGACPTTLVSRIAAIHQKKSSGGRVMMRTTYEVAGYSARGEKLGVARGFSLDVGGEAGVAA
jgi:hypothetical protein